MHPAILEMGLDVAGIFTPNLRLACVEQLDLELLRRLNLNALLLDVDCTLKEYRSATVPEPIAAWISACAAACLPSGVSPHEAFTSSQ